MDVVYMVRPGDDNEELRYSLRSLANLAHGRVWFVGYRPMWVDPTRVGVVPLDQKNPKRDNTWRVWRHMATLPVDDFILMNDDFFIMCPMGSVPVWHAGPVAEWVAGLGPAIKTVEQMSHTVDALSTLPDMRTTDHLLSFELHVPMPMERGTLAEVMAFGQRYRDVTGCMPLCKRTLYGNYAGLRGTRLVDTKVRDPKVLPPKGAAIVSTADETFALGRVGQMIRAAFPDPSPYEMAGKRLPQLA